MRSASGKLTTLGKKPVDRGSNLFRSRNEQERIAIVLAGPLEPAPISKISGFLDKMFRPVMTQIVVALLILLVGFIIGRLLGKITGKLLRELEINKTFANAVGLNISIEQAISAGVSYIIYAIVIIMSLNHLGLIVYFIDLLLIIAVSMIVLSVFLGIKDFVPNIIAGFLIRRKQIVKKGDRISFHSMEGEITQANILEIKMNTKQGDVIFIPSSLLIKEKLVKKRL